MNRALQSIAAASGLLVATLLACGEEPPPEAPVARPVKILTLSADSGGDQLEFPGTIQAAQRAEMAFEQAGRVVEFPVDEGQRVSEDQLLARIDPRDQEAAQDVQDARVRQARSEYERQKKLFEQEVASQQELERARRAYEVAQANSVSASKGVEDTELHAPFPGVVAKKLVKDFANVQAKEPVLILEDTSSLEISVAIPESDFATMQPGLTLEQRTARIKPAVVVTSLPDRRFPARIKEFNTTADPITRTFRATLAFDAPSDVVLNTGVTAKATITVPRVGRSSDGFTIPASAALIDESGKAYVWTVDPSMQVRKMPVTLGDMSGADVVVSSGLSAGQQIAVSGVNQLRDGQTVRRLED